MKAAVIIAALALTAVVLASDPNAPHMRRRLQKPKHTSAPAPAPKPFVVPTGKDGVQPEQIHIAYAGAGGASTYAVSWFTYNTTETSVVQYGTTSGGPYPLSDSGVVLNYFPDSYPHHVVLTQLQFGETYYYIVGDTATGVFSAELSFVAPRPVTDNVTPLKVAQCGDMGISNSNATIANLIARLNEYEAVIHIGDYSYADDRDLQPQLYESIWNEWSNSIQPVAATKPYMSSPGNHEASCRQIGSLGCDARHDNFTAYRYRFRMPSAETGGVDSMYYSYNLGMVHFVSISTETDFPSAPEGPDTLWNGGPFGDQLAWLDADLAAAASPANRALRPWIVVVGHRPIYTTSAHDFPFFAKENLQKYVEPLFLKYGVDMYFSGHVHAYERNWPVCTNTVEQTNYVNPKCPVYIVNGAAGNTEGHSDFTAATQPFTAYRNSANYGFGELTFWNASAVTWQYIRADDNGVDDTFTLIKDQH